MRNTILSYFFIFIMQSIAYGDQSVNGLIVYSSSRAAKTEFDINGLNQKQPDSVFYSVTFEKSFSISYFFPGGKNFYPADYTFSDLEKYSLNFIDSGFSIKKNLLCNNLYKMPFRGNTLYDSNERLYLTGVWTKKYFSVNQFDDTTFYFTTDEFPKSAGIIFFNGFEKCILGITSKRFSILPIIIDRTIKFERGELMRKIPKNLLLSVRNEPGIVSPFSEIKVNYPFPIFSAEDIRGEKISDKCLVNNTGKCTIILITNFIRFCNNYNLALEKYYVGANVQINSILKGMNELANQKNQKYMVVTTDYYEEISRLNFPNLYIVSNGAEWIESMNIFQFPFFLLVDNMGKVREIFSLFDIDASEGYSEGLLKLIEDYETNKKKI